MDERKKYQVRLGSVLAELDNLRWVHVHAFKICPQ